MSRSSTQSVEVDPPSVGVLPRCPHHELVERWLKAPLQRGDGTHLGSWRWRLDAAERWLQLLHEEMHRLQFGVGF